MSTFWIAVLILVVIFQCCGMAFALGIAKDLERSVPRRLLITVVWPLAFIEALGCVQ